MIWLSAAQAIAAPLVLVIASESMWDADCIGRRIDQPCEPTQRIKSSTLAYTDADADRVVSLLRQSLPQQRILRFSSSAPHPARLDDILLALKTAVQNDTEPVDLHVYLAAHGDGKGIHLDDRYYPFSGFIEMIDNAIDESAGVDRKIRTMVADVCLSARWANWKNRGDQSTSESRYPPVEEHPDGYMELSVDSLTPEDPILKGGYFTLLLLSGLTGGADSNLDNTVTSQEISNYINAYQDRNQHIIVPYIRTPNSPLDQIDLFLGDSIIELGADDSSRYVISSSQEPARVLLDVFVPEDEQRRLHLPAGRYHVRRYLYRQEVGLLARLFYLYYETCAIDISPANPSSWSTCNPSMMGWFPTRGDTYRTPSPEETTNNDSINTYILSTAGKVPAPLPQRDTSYHLMRRLWVLGGIGISSAMPNRERMNIAYQLGLRRSGDLGTLDFTADLRYEQERDSTEITGSDPSKGSQLLALVGFDQLIAPLTRPHLRTGMTLRAGGGYWSLNAPELPIQRAPLLALELGASISYVGARWRIELHPSWQPRAFWTDNDLTDSPDLEAAPDRWGSTVWFGYNF